MTVLDSYALIAAAAGEPAAAEVEALLRTEPCALTTAGLAELYDHLIRRVGFAAEEVDDRVEPLLGEMIVLRELDAERAANAGRLRARLYRRRTSELSLADCVLLASLDEGDQLATADPPLARAARDIGFAVVALPDTRGRRP